MGLLDQRMEIRRVEVNRMEIGFGRFVGDTVMMMMMMLLEQFGFDVQLSRLFRQPEWRVVAMMNVQTQNGANTEFQIRFSDG